jgi:hypothetical protein
MTKHVMVLHLVFGNVGYVFPDYVFYDAFGGGLGCGFGTTDGWGLGYGRYHGIGDGSGWGDRDGSGWGPGNNRGMRGGR